MDRFFGITAYNAAQYCLSKYVAEMGWKTFDDVVIDVLEIYDSVIYPEFEVLLFTSHDLGYEGEKKVWGKTIVTDNEIYIDSSIDKKDPRFAFTLAHEIGHALLHDEKDLDLKYTTESIFEQGYVNELHADCFAENLIIPAEFFKYRFAQRYEPWKSFAYKGPGDYLVNNKIQYVTSLEDLYQKMAEPLTPFFSNVSKDLLARILRQWNLVVDETAPKIMESTPLSELKVGSPLHKFCQEQERRRIQHLEQLGAERIKNRRR